MWCHKVWVYSLCWSMTTVIDQHNEYTQTLWHHIMFDIFSETNKHQNLTRLRHHINKVDLCNVYPCRWVMYGKTWQLWHPADRDSKWTNNLIAECQRRTFNYSHFTADDNATAIACHFPWRGSIQNIRSSQQKSVIWQSHSTTNQLKSLPQHLQKIMNFCYVLFFWFFFFLRKHYCDNCIS